jgi:hypothetical protein
VAEVGALYMDPDRWRQGAGRPFCQRPSNFGFAVEEGVEKLEERSGHRVIRLRLS